MRLEVSSIILLLFLIVGCDKNSPPPPSWFPKFYAGDSRLRLVISSDEMVIRCEDKEFDDLVCMNRQEIANQIRDRNKLIEACERWKQ